MAKRRKKRPSQAVQTQPKAQEQQERSVPKFEIGVKGDEFDVAYTRAAAAETEKVSALMSGLSRESKKLGFDLLNFAILSLLIIMIALSFAFLSRGESAPTLKIQKLADGTYLSQLSEYYNSTLPFGDVLRTLGANLGLCDPPEGEPGIEAEPEHEQGPEPAVTTTTAATEPEVTTAPTTTEAPTSAPISETTELEVPETTMMYAADNANIRLSPDNDSVILGYFYTNNKIEVIEIMSDGWASIWYNNIIAYVRAEDLSHERVVTTVTTTEEEETEETEETTEEVTTVPEEETEPETTFEEITTAPEPEPEETTSDPNNPGFDVSAYWEFLLGQSGAPDQNGGTP